MLRRPFIIALLVCGSLLRGQELTPEEMATAATGESISLPMPGELFAALGKQGKPDWSAMVRKTPASTFTNRQQLALNLGGLIADGYLAVEAQDAQQVKNAARDIKALAKGLGVEQDLINRGNSIVEFAEKAQWATLREELEAAQNEVIAAMTAHQDQDLVTLVMLGGWLRGTEVVSTHIAAHYTEAAARVLRQPAVVQHFVQKLATMPKKIADTPLLNVVRTGLAEIQKATFKPASTLSAEEVTMLCELTKSVMNAIVLKDQ